MGKKSTLHLGIQPKMSEKENKQKQRICMITMCLRDNLLQNF